MGNEEKVRRLNLSLSDDLTNDSLFAAEIKESLNKQQLSLLLDAFSSLYEICVDKLDYYSSFNHFDEEKMFYFSEKIDELYGFIMFFGSSILLEKGGAADEN